MADVPYESPVLLAYGLAVEAFDELRPRWRSASRVTTEGEPPDDVTAGWGENPLAGAACKGEWKLFDRVNQQSRWGPSPVDVALAARLCWSCPVRDACEDRVKDRYHVGTRSREAAEQGETPEKEVRRG